MVGTKSAAVLVVINVLFASILGIGAGGLTCLMLRRHWALRTALTDAGVAGLVSIVAAYAVSVVDTYRGVWQSRVKLMLLIAALSVIGRHVLRPRHHPSPEPTQPL